MITDRLKRFAIAVITIGCGFLAAATEAAVCDVDSDGDVDRNDIALIAAARNTPASGPDDPRDANGDGMITILDSRTCTASCTLARCEVVTSTSCNAGTSCSTGEAGICSAGLTACPDGPTGAPVCERTNDPAPEVCSDGLDNDCDGEVDDADVCTVTCSAGTSCSTGEAGICSAGLTACPDGPTGAPVCERTNDPAPEVCSDGLDNDCDGEVDDADVCTVTCSAGTSCSTGEAGICSAGLTACPDGPTGAPVCERTNDPAPEVCGDGLDNDCDGEVDDADVCAVTCSAGTSCSTGEAGICSAGLTACPDGPDGAPVCERTNDPATEICGDGLDNDCDGLQDDPDVCTAPTCTAGASCATGQPGVCAAGRVACPDGAFGAPVCAQTVFASTETCDNLDNDCDGGVDEDFNLGTQCNTGGLGVCAPGVLACGVGGVPNCVPNSGPQPEICNDGIDQNCDGSDCVLLGLNIGSPAAGFVTRLESITVSGTADANAVSVAVNGVAASLAGAAFSVEVPLRSGPNMLVAVATDANGNTGTDSVLVTRDIIAPNVQINSPPNGFKAIINKVTVTGLVNDMVTGGVTPRVTVNGIEAFVQQGTFMVTNVPLVRGPNTITARAVDSVGNEGTKQIQVDFDPPVGAKLLPFSGDGQAALVGGALPAPLVVRVVDNSGNPLASRVARFEVLRSDGVLTGPSGKTGRVIEVPTNGAGLASVTLKLGNRSGEGNNQVKVSSVGASGEAIFCATGQAALPSKILATMGENQKGLAGSPLAEPFEVLVVDPAGNPIGGQEVTFTVTRGGGNLSGATTQTISVDADGVGRAVLRLGPQEGYGNNIVEANFVGNPGQAAIFIASGFVAGAPSDTRFAGVVLDNTNTPIPGANIRIEGSDGDVLTDEEGQFLLTGVPVGAVDLFIEASVSPRPQTFPDLHFEANTIAGRVNGLPTGPIRIPALVSDVQLVGGAQDVVLQMPGVPGLTLTVFAGSTTFPGGSSTGLVSINQVHLDKVPMPPPSGTIFMPPAWTVQPPGVQFDPPAKITIPNDGLPPGRVIDIFQFDHDLNRFVNIGPGTTDEDGLLIVSDPGFGITKSGWGGCGQPQPPQTCASGCGECEKCDAGACVADTGKNGTMCDDKNACTKGTMCGAGKCEGGETVMNTTGSDADKKAWRAFLESCQKSKTMKAICEDPNIGSIDAKVGRSQPGVVTDSWDSKEIDLDDLDAIDKLRCSWSGDSCQDIIHFMRERLSGHGGDNFDDSHSDGFKDETEYRKEKGWKGAKTGCFFIGSDLVCNYDDDGDGVTDRTETLALENDNYKSVTCSPAT